MLFHAEGFVDTENPSEYMSAVYFDVDRNMPSLEFGFFAEGKHIFFHVKDPAGIIRVQRMGAAEPVRIILHSRHDKTGIGTIPGEIQQGRWQIAVYTFGARTTMRLGRTPYSVSVHAPDEDAVPVCGYESWTDSKRLAEGEFYLRDFEPVSGGQAENRWLSGDFHVHSILSDGSSNPCELINEGISKNLDFFFITEHNILTPGFPSDKKISVFPAFEATTCNGHFNAFGLKYMPEWFLAEGPAPSPDAVEKLMTDFRSEGALISINHPFFHPWQWVYDSIPLSLIDAIEVITDPMDLKLGDTNEKAIALIDLLWMAGYRITGVGGSDTHTRHSATQLGEPLTMVYAGEGSLTSVIEAVGNQRVKVVPDPGVRLSCLAGEREMLPGSLVSGNGDADIAFSLSVAEGSGCGMQKLEIVEDCEKVHEAACSPGESVRVEWKFREGSRFLRCGLRDREGKLSGFINPVYRNISPGGRKGGPRPATWGDAAEILGF